VFAFHHRLLFKVLAKFALMSASLQERYWTKSSQEVFCAQKGPMFRLNLTRHPFWTRTYRHFSRIRQNSTESKTVTVLSVTMLNVIIMSACWEMITTLKPIVLILLNSLYGTTTLSIMTLSIMILNVTFSITDPSHNVPLNVAFLLLWWVSFY